MSHSAVWIKAGGNSACESARNGDREEEISHLKELAANSPLALTSHLLVAGGLVLWKSFLPTTPSKEPGKLSIAVLPFDNMSEDPKQVYFSDGCK